MSTFVNIDRLAVTSRAGAIARRHLKAFYFRAGPPSGAEAPTDGRHYRSEVAMRMEYLLEIVGVIKKMVV